MSDFGVEDGGAWTIPDYFPIGERELGMPGGREISGELDEYLNSKGIRDLFTELGEMLLHKCPDNPIHAIITHLHQHYPDQCHNPVYLTAVPFGDEIARA